MYLTLGSVLLISQYTTHSVHLRKKNIRLTKILLKMLENSALISLSYFLFIQISLINSKSQLFQLKNDRIVLIESTNSLQQDEIFTLISSNKQDGNNFWIKDNESYEFAFEIPSSE